MNKIISAIFGIDAAALIYTHLFFLDSLTKNASTEATAFWIHLGVFVACFILAFFVIHKHVSTFGGPIQMFLGTLALLGLIVAMLYHILPITPIYTFPHMIDPAFTSDTAFTAWLIAPLAVMVF